MPPTPISGLPQRVSGAATHWSLGLRFSPSLFLFQPGPTSNHQFLPSPVPPFPLLRSGSFSPKCPCREQEVGTGAGPRPGCFEITVPLLPEGGPTVHRKPGWSRVSLEAKNTPESNCPKLNQRPPCTCFLEDLRSPRLLLMHWDSRPSRDGVAPTRITFWTGSPDGFLGHQPGSPVLWKSASHCCALFPSPLLSCPNFPGNWEPPPSAQSPCLLTHCAAQLKSIWPCPRLWHPARWPCLRDAPSSDLLPSASMRIMSIENFTISSPRRKSPLIRGGGRAHSPRRRILCQVEWESQSYQLITF